jgi:hypothetical protein
MSRLLIRITRFSDSKGEIPLGSVLSNICIYLWVNDCGPELMKAFLRKVTLDGEDLVDISGGRKTEGEEKSPETYIVDTYEAIIAKNK